MLRARALAIGLVASMAIVCAGTARAAAPRYPDIMPISQVKAGMRGYGLTVFHGTTIEKFDVRVVGVVKKGSLIVPGHDMILVKMYGGPMTTRQANLIRGMSGSPVYINGKIIGAFSQGEPMTKEPLGGVTPIEDMLEAWDPKLPDTVTSWLRDNRTQTVQLAAPIVADGRRIDKVVYNVPASSRLRSHGSTLVMQPCTTLMAFSGLSGIARQKLQKALEPYHVELAQDVGMGRKTDFKGAPLVPGAAFSMMLITGDLSSGATGTVSYRRGDRILGFGHPFMGIGPIEAPLCSAYVYDVYPLLSGSYKISSPGPVVGTSAQDRNFSISGFIGRPAKTIPVTVDVRDVDTGRSRVFHMESVAHPYLYASLVSSAVSAAIDEIRSTPGAAMAQVETTVDAEEIGKVSRTNTVFDARGVDSAATADLDDLLGIFSSNPFYPLGIKSANVKVVMQSGHKTAQIDRIFLKEGRFEPGETAEVGVVIKPYKQPAVTRTMKITIPANTPSGRYVLMVRGGAVPAAISFGGLILRPSASSGTEQLPPANIRQMVTRYNEREKNNDLVARLILPTTAVSVDGEKLSNLPPSLDAIMRSTKSSGVRMERDEVKVVEPTDWVVSGTQALQINVQRKDIQETPLGGGSTGAPAGMAPPSMSPSSGQGFDRDFSADSSDDGESLTFANSTPAPKPAKTAKPAPAKAGAQPLAAAAGPAGAPADTNAKPAGSADTAAQGTDKPVGRAPSVWRQTTRADFAKGASHGVAVSTQGNLVLTRMLSKVQATPETFIWSLVPDGKGGFFAGTGTQGKVLRLDAAGKVSTFATLPEVSVHSLLVADDGTLYAGTGPNGRVYRIDAAGKATVALQADKSKYALALARDGSGNVYVGTGGGSGTVYRIGTDGKSSILFRSPEEHVLALAVDKAGNVYAGTASDGLVYRIDPAGQAKVVMDPPEQSVTALALNSKGELYAATAPRGVIYKVAEDGTWKTVFDKSPAAFTALAAGPTDTIYAAAGSGIYRVLPDDSVLAIDNAIDVDILSLALGQNGALYAGSGNTGDIYATGQAGDKLAGTYESLVHDAKGVSRWGAIRWQGVVPLGAHMAIQTRTGNVADPDATWSAWSTPKPEADGGRIMSPPARFIQYRVSLTGDSPSVTPMLREVSLTYLPRNQAPKVAFQSPTGGERWARQQTLRWSGDDPDKDTLSYELFYSTDFGATWQPLPAGQTTTATTTTAAAPSTTPSTAAAGAHRPPSVSEVTAELDKHPDLPPALRQAVIDRTAKINEQYQSGGAAASGAAAATPGVLRETNRQLDTKLLPDGSYLLKVVATDRASNPIDAQTAEAISEPFVICNAAPVTYILQAGTKVNADRTVALEGVAVQKDIAVTAVQYRVDGGDWVAAVPADGLFDSPIESFTITSPALTKGSHTIEVKAFNAAGTTATDKTTVEVK